MDRLIDFSSLKKNKYFNSLFSLLILLLIFLIGFFVYFTGGTTSFVHLMYVPILITVFIFGIKAGVLVSFIAGFVLGPNMPLVVSQGIMQENRSWMFRIVMFVIIVFVVGLLLKYIENYYDLEKNRAYQDIITGYPNSNKFKEDLEEMISAQKHKILSLIVFEFKNREMINQYVDYNTGQKSFQNLVNSADDFFEIYDIYTLSPSKFVIIIPDFDHLDAYTMANDFYDKTKSPMYIGSLPISIIIKGGIVSYPFHSDEINDIILKLDKTLSQVSKTQKSIIIYDDFLEEERKKYYNTLVSLYHSLQNDMFTLVFQPKVRIGDNKIVGVEALLRMKNKAYSNISIAQLINIAEDAGFINEITKWVVANSIKQIKEWQDEGLQINISINLSTMDLNDDSIVIYTKNCLESYQVDSSFLEFELTERSIIEDDIRVFNVLKKIKDIGIKISLDDYGSGYNSLIYLVNETFPYDYIKIDKMFIDNIDKKQNKSLTSGIIEAAHALGMEVVAEGVETAEQVNILKDVGCDIIQGYYFSKPLAPKELNDFILSML